MSVYGDLINKSLSEMIQDKFNNKIKEQNSNWDVKKYKKAIRSIKKDIYTFRNMSQTKGTSSALQSKLKNHLKFLEKQKKELDFLAFENGVM